MRPLLTQLVLLCTLGPSLPALAQTTGTVDLTGSVEPTASVTYDSFNNSGFGSPVTGSNAGSVSGGEASLDFTLELGNLAPTSTLANFAYGDVFVRLRSNAPYTLSGELGGGSTFDPGGVLATDIGFGAFVPAIPLPASVNPSHGTSVEPGFGQDPTSVDTSSGAPDYSAGATLASFSTPSVFASGNRISSGGSTRSPDNYVVLGMRYAVYRQLWTGGTSFGAVMLLTLATP